MLLCRWYAHLHRGMGDCRPSCPAIIYLVFLFYSISYWIARTFDTVPFLGLCFLFCFEEWSVWSSGKWWPATSGNLVVIDSGSKAGLSVGFAPLQFCELRRFHVCEHRDFECVDLIDIKQQCHKKTKNICGTAQMLSP